MFSNNYAPHIGGVARSVATWAKALRDRGHAVLIVTPQAVGQPEHEPGVLRYPALTGIYRREFSVPWPALPWLCDKLQRFRPDLIHSHHPFLLGNTAMRLAARWRLPLVFTNHTQYHLYSHYLGFESGFVQRLVRGIAVGYANGCEAVVAPSESIAAELRCNGVKARLEVIPTGVELARFRSGDRQAFRRQHGIPYDAFLIGHIGRLAPEKNLGFLLDALLRFLAKCSDAHAVIAGEGTYKTELQRQISASAMRDRIVLLGNLSPAELQNAYAAFDVFIFASLTETQGMVVIEAMAAGVPVIALDAPGIREVVRNDFNGYLLPEADTHAFSTAMHGFVELPAIRRDAFKRAATATAEAMSMSRCIDRLISLYQSLLTKRALRAPSLAHGLWGESRIWKNMACALSSAGWPRVRL